MPAGAVPITQSQKEGRGRSMNMMTRRRCTALMILLLLSAAVLFIPTSEATAQMRDPLFMEEEIIPALYLGDYEVVEMSLLIQTPDGLMYRISRLNTDEEGPWVMGMFDPLGPEQYGMPFQVYWGQIYVEGAMTMIRGMWEEVKAFLIEILDVLKGMFDLFGVLVLLVCSAFLNYFLSTGFPTFPPRVLFYLVFVLCSTVWIYLTGVWMSVFYASGILLLPHLVLALVGFLYRMTLGRLFGRKSRSSRVVRKTWESI